MTSKRVDKVWNTVPIGRYDIPILFRYEDLYITENSENFPRVEQKSSGAESVKRVRKLRPAHPEVASAPEKQARFHNEGQESLA
jgi:hypothetical protein